MGTRKFLEQFNQHPNINYGLFERKSDGKVFEWEEFLELFNNQQTTSQHQTIERLRELCRRAYTAIRHETNPSNSMLDVYFDIEKEVILNTTEPIDQ